MWCDALTIKVREGGRTVNVHAVLAVGVSGDGGREVLGLEVASQEDGAGWLSFLRSLTARGLAGARLVISDAHRGLVDAIAAALPGASWQRCRNPLPAQPVDQGAQVGAALGGHHGSHHLRPTRRRLGA